MLIELSPDHSGGGDAYMRIQTAIVDDVETGTEVSAISLAPFDEFAIQPLIISEIQHSGR